MVCMVDKESLQKEVDELEKLASDIETRERTLIEYAPKSSQQKYASATKEYYNVYEWKELTKDLENLRRDLTRDYQRWYSSAYPLVNKYIPEKEAEFKRCYGDGITVGILKMVQLRGTPHSTPDMIDYFVKEFEIQRSILLSIPEAARIKELIK